MSGKRVTGLFTSTFGSLSDRATKHPFLKAAGQGQVSKEILSQWLAQDRLYAQSYVRFIGLLLSKVCLPSGNPNTRKSQEPTTEQRVFDILVEVLVNIQRELCFFESIAAEYGLDLTALPSEVGGEGISGIFGPSPITRAYIDLFMSAGSAGASLLEGMSVLFSTEYCYLHAWKYAAFISMSSSTATSLVDDQEDADGGALRQRLIPNWSSLDFEEFVLRLQDVTDELGGRVKGAEEGERERGKCLGWWKQVLWLEERFWPQVEVAIDGGDEG
jgi:thiaminase